LRVVRHGWINEVQAEKLLAAGKDGKIGDRYLLKNAKFDVHTVVTLNR
jgi:hypothetical protein